MSEERLKLDLLQLYYMTQMPIFNYGFNKITLLIVSHSQFKKKKCYRLHSSVLLVGYLLPLIACT